MAYESKDEKFIDKNFGYTDRDRIESSHPILDVVGPRNPVVFVPSQGGNEATRVMDTRMPKTRITAPDFLCGSFSLDEYEERAAQYLKQSRDRNLMEVAADIVSRVSPLDTDTRVRTGEENSYTLARKPELIYDDFKKEYFNYGFKDDTFVRTPTPDFVATGNVEGIAAIGSALKYLLGRPAGPEES